MKRWFEIENDNTLLGQAMNWWQNLSYKSKVEAYYTYFEAKRYSPAPPTEEIYAMYVRLKAQAN